MVGELSWQWQILILLQIIRLSSQLNHQFVPEKEDLFSDCTDKPGYQSVDQMSDFSQFIRKRNKNGGIDIHGNITMKWDIQPSDRVSVSALLP